MPRHTGGMNMEISLRPRHPVVKIAIGIMGEGDHPRPVAQQIQRRQAVSAQTVLKDGQRPGHFNPVSP